MLVPELFKALPQLFRGATIVKWVGDDGTIERPSETHKWGVEFKTQEKVVSFEEICL